MFHILQIVCTSLITSVLHWLRCLACEDELVEVRNYLMTKPSI